MYLYFTNNGSLSIKYSKHNIQQNKRVLSSKSSAAGVASDKGDAKSPPAQSRRQEN